MEEGVFLVIGLTVLSAFGFALIGVPMLFKRTRLMREELAQVNEKLSLVINSQPYKKGSGEESVYSADTNQHATADNNLRPIDEPSSETVQPRTSENKLFDALQKQVDKSITEAAPAESSALVTAAPEGDVPGSAQSTSTQSEISGSSFEEQAANIKTLGPTEQLDVTAVESAEAAGELTFWQNLLTKFSSINMTARIGSVVLIFGAVFLGKYASDIGVLTLEAKLAMMAVVSVALTVGGIWFADRLKQVGEVLQATGLAGWLVTLFMTHVLYDLIHWVPTLIAGVLAVGLIGYRSLKQNSQMLAMLAYFGGVLTPFIASSEASSLWRLFSYMCLLNVAAVFIANKRPWRWFVREVYIASFGLLGGLMMAEYLQSDLRHTAVQIPMAAFLASCVVLFSVLGTAWLKKQQESFVRHASGLLFAVPAAAVAALQALFHEQDYTMALSLVVMSVWYGALTYGSRSFYLLAITVVTGSMAIPFAFNDGLTSVVYSLEGAGFIWWAVIHQKRSSFIWGLVLQLSSAAFAFHLFTDIEIRQSALNLSWFLYGAVVVVAGFSAWLIKEKSSPIKFVSNNKQELAFLASALFIWFYMWGFWLAETVAREQTLWAMCLVFIGSIAAIYLLETKFNWPALRHGVWISANSYLACVLLYLVDYSENASSAPLLVLAALTALLFSFRLFLNKKWSQLWPWDATVHWLVLPWVLSITLYQVPETVTDWNLVLALIVLVLLLKFLTSLLPPLFLKEQHYETLKWVSLVLIIIGVSLTMGALGNYAPLPFWPLLHPLNIIAALTAWFAYRLVMQQTQLRAALAIWAGLLFTIELNRWLFHYAGVNFTVDAWLNSDLTQTVWSLIWALVGSALMVSGGRLLISRSAWITGAVVIAIVVVKLFIIDLSQVDTLYRILSFIGVGGLLLAVGSISPMPEKSQTE